MKNLNGNEAFHLLRRKKERKIGKESKEECGGRGSKKVPNEPSIFYLGKESGSPHFWCYILRFSLLFSRVTGTRGVYKGGHKDRDGEIV